MTEQPTKADGRIEMRNHICFDDEEKNQFDLLFAAFAL